MAPTLMKRSPYKALLYDGNYIAAGHLEEPLLHTHQSSVEECKSGDALETYDDISPNYSDVWFSVSCFLAGCMAALISQNMLSFTLWKFGLQYLLSCEMDLEVHHLILFSLLWAGFTCAMIFCGMVVTTEISRRWWLEGVEMSRSTIVKVEVHYIVGSLWTVSATWLIYDMASWWSALDRTGSLGSIPPTLALCFALLGLSFVAWFALVLLCSTSSNTAHSEPKRWISRRYNALAGILGFSVGVESQYMLSNVMWQGASTDTLQTPIVDSILGFAALWSVCTVAMTAVGCVVLRCLPNQVSLRAALRMEAWYIGTSLLGICGAWIAIDCAQHRIDQILPSLIMLFISLSAFGGILWCLPEDTCLAESYDIPITKDKSRYRTANAGTQTVLMIV